MSIELMIYLFSSDASLCTTNVPPSRTSRIISFCPLTNSNLFFIGMFQPLGCIWPGSEQQAKLLALTLNNKWKRPSNIKDLCESEVTNPHMKQIDTNRHRITVDFHKFMSDLKKQISVSD